MNKVSDDNRCFACGKENPIGLKLDFTVEGGDTVSRLNFHRNFAGWENMVHGGILSTVLDEVMVKSAAGNGYVCVTAELNVRYKKPCQTERDYILRGRVKEVHKRLIFTEAEILDDSGALVVSGQGKLFLVDTVENLKK